MKNRTIILFFVILLAFSQSYATFTKLGMASMTFLKLGIGRATGMGDAFVAIADDASATFWNPAGLALIKNRQVMLNHIDWILDTRHEYITAAFPTKIGTLGFALTSVNYGEFEETTIDEYQGTGRTFGASDMAFGASYARMFTDKFAFGASVKVMDEQVWNLSCPAVAFDFGTHYNTGWKNLRLAMAIANFGPDVQFSGKQLNFEVTSRTDWTWPWTYQALPASYTTEKFPLPVTFRFGLADDIISTENMRLTFAADLVHFNDVNEQVNIGAEYKFMNFFLRGGYILNTDSDYSKELGWRSGLSFGASVNVNLVSNLDMQVDYAYRDLARLGVSHRIGLTVGF
jgi:hypothetical protein